MKLIIGLGNPGVKYQFTRHNIGFLVLDALASELHVTANSRGFNSFFGKGRIGDIPVLLAKPQTYMNLSGTAVKYLMDYFKNDIKDIIIIHDDLDLPFKTIRLKAGGGHGGHKGLISIIESLDSSEFIRVRLGIGKPVDKTFTEDYVLDPFTKDEMDLLPDILTNASEAVSKIVTSGIQAAMNQYNERTSPQSTEEDNSETIENIRNT
ncbi:MAG: aminoacyl-tRNA hydrolase [Deltaproteobacteria bacterium]|nr:aminoacyl-tRNA hydrolase [Deltaproteobacteria bacterium]